MPNRSTPYGLRYSGVFKDQVNGQTELYDDGILNQTLAGSAETGAGIQTVGAELRVAEGFNVRVGTISPFATTEPTNAIVFKQGTAYAGAIATSGGLQSSATVVTKIIAAGTVSNVET